MFAVIHLPDFALQAALRHEPELHSRAVALVDERDTKPAVFQLTQAARMAGVCEGLTSTQALARCSAILIKPRSLSQEQAANRLLLQCAYDFSPRIEATADGICTLDLKGLPVAAGTAEQPNTAAPRQLLEWSEAIIAALAQFNLQAQIGIAVTPNLALHAARCADPVLFVADPQGFIAAQPIGSLEPSPEIASILQRWGIRTVGAFIALGKERIIDRLGVDALELFERASTNAARPLVLVTPPETFEEAADFETEIETLQPLLFILRRFVEQLSKRLSLGGAVVEQLHLRLKLSSGQHYERTLKIPAPTGDVDTLFRTLHTHLETVRTDSPIVSLQLSARPCRGGHYQFGLFEPALRDPNQFHETLARLTALCGADRVGTPVPEQSHRPDAFRMETPKFDAPEAVRAPQSTTSHPAGLCLRRFRPPIHADVEIKNGRPVFISTLKFTSPVEQIRGPWRASGNWWEQPQLWNRDEWDIQTRDGALYRIYQERENWFLEGVYD